MALKMYHPLYLITGQPSNDEKQFLKKLTFSLKAGVRLIQFRAKALEDYDYKKLAIKAIKLCHDYNAKVLLNTQVSLYKGLRADGIHLPSNCFMQYNKRPISSQKILSVSCHNEEQVLHAIKMNVEIILISPIFATPSSPKGKPLGWEGFSYLARLTKIPTYALGGLKPEDLTLAKTYGAHGIAAIRSLWGF